jgi:hypothetical protein
MEASPVHQRIVYAPQSPGASSSANNGQSPRGISGQLVERPVPPEIMQLLRPQSHQGGERPVGNDSGGSVITYGAQVESRIPRPSRELRTTPILFEYCDAQSIAQNTPPAIAPTSFFDSLEQMHLPRDHEFVIEDVQQQPSTRVSPFERNAVELHVGNVRSPVTPVYRRLSDSVEHETSPRSGIAPSWPTNTGRQPEVPDTRHFNGSMDSVHINGDHLRDPAASSRRPPLPSKQLDHVGETPASISTATTPADQRTGSARSSIYSSQSQRNAGKLAEDRSIMSGSNLGSQKSGETDVSGRPAKHPAAWGKGLESEQNARGREALTRRREYENRLREARSRSRSTQRSLRKIPEEGSGADTGRHSDATSVATSQQTSVTTNNKQTPMQVPAAVTPATVAVSHPVTHELHQLRPVSLARDDPRAGRMHSAAAPRSSKPTFIAELPAMNAVVPPFNRARENAPAANLDLTLQEEQLRLSLDRLDQLVQHKRLHSAASSDAGVHDRLTSHQSATAESNRPSRIPKIPKSANVTRIRVRRRSPRREDVVDDDTSPPTKPPNTTAMSAVMQTDDRATDVARPTSHGGGASAAHEEGLLPAWASKLPLSVQQQVVRIKKMNARRDSDRHVSHERQAQHIDKTDDYDDSDGDVSSVTSSGDDAGTNNRGDGDRPGSSRPPTHERQFRNPLEAVIQKTRALGIRPQQTEQTIPVGPAVSRAIGNTTEVERHGYGDSEPYGISATALAREPGFGSASGANTNRSGTSTAVSGGNVKPEPRRLPMPSRSKPAISLDDLREHAVAMLDEVYQSHNSELE